MSVSFYSNIVQIPRLASIGQAVRRPVTNQTFSLNDIEALFSEVREVCFIYAWKGLLFYQMIMTSHLFLTMPCVLVELIVTKQSKGSLVEF